MLEQETTVRSLTSTYYIFQEFLPFLSTQELQDLDNDIANDPKFNKFYTPVFLQAFFKGDSSGQYKSELEREVARNFAPCDLMGNMAIKSLARNLFKHEQDFKHQLAMLLSFDSDNIPEEFRKKFNFDSSKMQVSINSENWYLCSATEERLVASQHKGLTVLVNNRLLVKHYGKIAALSLESFTNNASSTFLEGSWYCPEIEMAENIRKNLYEHGLARMDIDKGNWFYIRSLKSGTSRENRDFINQARLYAENLPSKFASPPEPSIVTS